MKKWWSILCCILIIFSSCAGLNFSNKPAADKVVFEKTDKLSKTPNDEALQNEFTLAYANAVNLHKNNIAQYTSANQPDKWERIMTEYSQLNQLSDAVAVLPSVGKLVKVQRYDSEYNDAKEQAAESLYRRANAYLDTDNRSSALQAYNLLKKANQIIPGYKDVNNLINIASEKSTLSIVINPVNYYSQSFSHWGLNNDYVQYQLTNDLRFQLGSANNVKVYTDREAYSNNIYPDRVVDITWDELFMPAPRQNTSTRQVLKKIKTGETDDKQPIYTTVTATIYVTSKTVQARGNLVCRITDPTTNRILLNDHFPGVYNWREEYATYRGDSRALSSYDWAMVNNSNLQDPSRNNLFNEVLRQVYPQLVNRIKSVTWYD